MGVMASWARHVYPPLGHDPDIWDRHIAEIRSNGRIAWQASTMYNQRSRIKTQLGRWKSVIGAKYKTRAFTKQLTEGKLGQTALDNMDELKCHVSKRIS